MGLGGISIGQLVILFLIIALLFGTKRLRGLGEDAGKALKGFRSALKEEEKPHPDANADATKPSTIDKSSS